MKLSKKDAADLNTAVEYIKKQKDLSVVHSYLNFMPIKGIALIKVLHASDTLVCKQSEFTAEDLERLIIERFHILAVKSIRDLETMHKTVLGLEKQNNIADARTVVKMMVAHRNYLGALVVRLLKMISDDWRMFFVKTLPALKKQYQ